MAMDVTGEWWVGSEAADIEAYLAAYAESESAYPITDYRSLSCPCGSDSFRLERAREVTRRVCAACGRSGFICRGDEDWQEAEAEESVEPYQCAECGCLAAQVGVGFAGYEPLEHLDAVKWFFVGVRCVHCGVLGSFNEGKVGWEPADQVYKSI